ncbi:MAG: ABC transporter permease subunit [Acidobacteriota bacterium]|nr:ABC transporter permease subunit [Acidobacteriota bacterium]
MAMAPFVVYTFLGLGIPVIAVVRNAFLDQHGKFTTSNISLLWTGLYRQSFYNSIKLSLITSIVPGVVGVFLAYAIYTSKSVWLKRLTTTASGVLANFGGVNLTFMFIAALGETGVTTSLLKIFHLNPWNHGFNLFSFYGIALVYMYFQIPLMVLVITPAFAGLRPAWREAAENMGASSWRYWRHVGIPVLLPSFLGGVLLLFGSAFAAYATAESLTIGIVPLAPIEIGNLLNGNVISNEVNVGYAIGFGMLVILTVTMVMYGLVRRRASKWLR